MSAEHQGLADLPARSECLYRQAQLESMMDALADRINRQMAGRDPVLVLVVMNGGMVGAGQLLPRLDFLLELDYVHVSRYGAGREGAALQWQHRPNVALKGRRVLLLDDILDRGITLKALVEYVLEQGAESVKTAALVQKSLSEAPAIEADFVGLRVPERFVFGFGMDIRGYWRNAPGIFVAPEGV